MWDYSSERAQHRGNQRHLCGTYMSPYNCLFRSINMHQTNINSKSCDIYRSFIVGSKHFRSLSRSAAPDVTPYTRLSLYAMYAMDKMNTAHTL